jgi:predicted nucleic acid-binding Zn ribbon protein
MPKWSGEGRLIPGSRCPKCNHPLEYNGNYWCSQEKCNYTMPGEPERMRQVDKIAFNIAYVLLMQQTGREPNPDSLYREVM